MVKHDVCVSVLCVCEAYYRFGLTLAVFVVPAIKPFTIVFVFALMEQRIFVVLRCVVASRDPICLPEALARSDILKCYISETNSVRGARFTGP